MPIGGSQTLAVGDVLIWDHAKATRLFDAMKNGQPVPKSLLSGSKLAGGQLAWPPQGREAAPAAGWAASGTGVIPRVMSIRVTEIAANLCHSDPSPQHGRLHSVCVASHPAGHRPGG